jgi:hypothetical protein
MPDIETFDHFKYAEEHAHRLHSQGKLFVMRNAFGVENEDHYLSDEFTVEVVGDADPSKVGKTGTYVGDEDDG